jgi:RimJ/RimL family protein N-acetyltransferase
MTEEEIRRRVHATWAPHELRADGDALFLGVEVVRTGDLIGDVQLICASVEHLCAEIGYVFHPAHTGQGYATEAAHQLLHLAFDDIGFRRVIARLDADNQGSARLAERLGMRQEAHLVQNEWFKGRWSDELDYAILADEWRELDHSAC